MISTLWLTVHIVTILNPFPPFGHSRFFPPVEKKMNHVAQRANSILQMPSPDWACIDSDPPIQECIDLGGEQVHIVFF
jgi:hypothetical protein